MKKIHFKVIGITLIICLLFLGFLKVFTNQSVAKAHDQGQVKVEESVKDKIDKDYNTMVKALKTSQGQLEGVSISIWGASKGKTYSIKEMEDISLECANILKLEKNAKIDFMEEEYFKKLMVRNQGKDISATIVMDVFKEGDLTEENYFLVELYLSKNYQDIKYLEKEIIEFLKEQGFDYDYAITINGSFPNKKNTDIMKDIISKTINSISGNTIEIIEYDDILSYTGYSPEILGNIDLAGEKVNLNVSMRYSQLNKETHIWIGTPLIFTDY